MPKFARTLAALTLAAALIAGCSGGKSSEPAPQSAATTPVNQNLIVGIDVKVNSLDPAVVYDKSTRIVVSIYENLVTLKKGTPEIGPQLAETWEPSGDGKVYTFHLRKGVKFHDGTDLTSEAVKLSLERMVKINKGPAWMFADEWEQIDTPDPLTVKITLKQPDSSFLAKMAGAAGPQIISAKAIKEHAADDNGQKYFMENEAGTGPYMVETWDKGQQVVLKRFDGYWGGWAGKHLDKVVFKEIKESSTQEQLLEKGELDVASGLPLDQVKALKQNTPAGIKLTDGKTQNIRYIVLNTQSGPLKDKRVRQAIAYAVDYNGLIANVWSNLEEPLIGPLPSADPNHYTGAWPYKLDMAKAKALLAEAGYPNGGFTLKLGLLENWDNFKSIAEVLQANLKDLGINVKIETVSVGPLYDLEGKLETAFDLVPIGNYPDYADSSAMLGNELASWAWGSAGYNWSYWKNDRVDQLLKEANATLDQQKRAALFQEIQQIFTDELPLVPVSTRMDITVLRSDVQGYYNRSLMSNSFPVYEVYKEAK